MKPKVAGVTNDQLTVCAGCDYRLEYDQLAEENKALKAEYERLQEIQQEDESKKCALDSKCIELKATQAVLVEALENPYRCKNCGGREPEMWGKSCLVKDGECCWFEISLDEALSQITQKAKADK